jgi:hypothetical protein
MVLQLGHTLTILQQFKPKLLPLRLLQLLPLTLMLVLQLRAWLQQRRHQHLPFRLQ